MVFFPLIFFFILHFIFWRFFLPKRKQLTLIILAVFTLLSFGKFCTGAELLLCSLIFCNYLCFYSGIEAQSLSLLIIRLIENEKKLSKEDLVRLIPQHFLQERFLMAKKIWFKGEQLKKSAKLMLTFFKIFKTILKLPEGG